MLSLFRAWQSREPTRAATACSRCMRQMALVDYRSDSSTSSSTSVRSATANAARRRLSSSARARGPFDTPLSKKRKPLPSLPGTYQTGINPRDDPAQHQGRKRTRPYVEGDYITHVSVSLSPPVPLVATLNALADHIQSLVPDYRIVRNYLPSNPALHVSLTHPLALRRSQIDDFRNDVFRACKSALPEGKGVAVSLAGNVRVYHNGTRTGGVGQGGRAFFALRLGAGQPELNRVKRALEPLLRKMHLPVYHGDDPEFHTSFAWCLLSKDPSLQGTPALIGAARPQGAISSEAQIDSTTSQGGAELPALLDDIDDSTIPESQEASTEGDCPPLPPYPLTDETLKEVSELFTSRLLEAQPKGGWEVDTISLRIANKLWDVPIC